MEDFVLAEIIVNAVPVSMVTNARKVRMIILLSLRLCTIYKKFPENPVGKYCSGRFGGKFSRVTSCFPGRNRDFKIQRRGRRRKRHKNDRFYDQNNNFVRVSRWFVHFFNRFCTTTTWKCFISRFMEYVNKQRRNAISLSELGYGP